MQTTPSHSNCEIDAPTEVIYNQNGHCFSLGDEGQLALFPEFHDHWHHCRTQCPGNSLLKNRDGFRIANAGLIPAMQYQARKNNLNLHKILLTAPIKQLSPPQNLNNIDYPSLASFVSEYVRGQINISHTAEPAQIVAELAVAYPTSRLIVVSNKICRLQSAYQWLKNHLPPEIISAGQLKLVHGRQGFTLEDDSLMPKIILSTFLEAVDYDFATSDIILLLDGRECTSEAAQIAIEAVDAQFRLYGIFKHQPKTPVPRYEYQITCAFFGFQIIDLMPYSRIWREAKVAWVPITGSSARRSSNRTTINYPDCYINNRNRNTKIAQLCRDLSDGRRISQHQSRDIFHWQSNHFRDSPTIAILVQHIEHAINLGRILPDWSIVAGNQNVNLTGLPRSLCRRIKSSPGFHDGKRQIVLVDTPYRLQGYLFDVVIWAGGGIKSDMIPSSWLYHHERESARPLLIMDFSDNFHRQTASWSKKRRQAFRDRALYSVREFAVEERIKKFLESPRRRDND